MISKRRDYKKFTPEELENFSWEKLFVDTTIKVDSYLEHLLVDAKEEIQNNKSCKEKTQDKKMLETFLEEVYASSSQASQSGNLKTIAAKYHHSKHLKTLLNNPDSGKTIKERFQTARKMLERPEVKTELNKSRGFWAWLRDKLGIKSSGASLGFFINKNSFHQEKKAVNEAQKANPQPSLRST